VEAMEQRSKEDEIALGTKAESVLESEAFKEATAGARENIMMKWRKSQKPHEREHCHAQIVALDEVDRMLRVFTDRGRDAHTKLAGQRRGGRQR